MYFDSHCHLDFDAYDAHREQVWERSRAKGIRRAVVPGTHPKQWSRLPALCELLQGVGYAVGLHPWWIDDEVDDRNLRSQLRDASRGGAVAIGETGFDQTRHAENTTIARQRELFEMHLEIASELDLPLIIHSVNAHEHTLDALAHVSHSVRGVVHSFSGSSQTAQRYLKLDFYVSFSCSSLRFGEKKAAAIRSIPDDRLLIETDAPDQSAQRDRPGSPLDLLAVVRHVASIRTTDTETIARHTTANARRLFGI